METAIDMNGWKERSASRAWATVAMLFGVQLINRADKAVLGLAAPALMAELALSPERFGIVASSFFFLYAVAGVANGYFLAPRYRPRIILAVMLAAWSLSQLPIIFAASFGTLLACRMLLGMAEGGATPVCVTATHEWFPSEKRNLPTSIVVVATVIGALVSAPVLSLIIDRYGWRASFLACAIGGGVMLALWLLFSRNGPYAGLAEPGDDGRPISGLKALSLLHDRGVYGTFLMGFSTDWVVAFTIAWLPSFCTLALHFTPVQTGWLLSAIFTLQAVNMVAMSAVSQGLIRRGISSRYARSGLTAVCLLVSALCMAIGSQVAQPLLCVALIGIGVGLPCVASTLNSVVFADMFPPRHRNRLYMLAMCAGAVGSMLAPWLTGKLLGQDAAGGWALALLLNAAILLVGGLVGLIFVDPERTARRLRAIDEAIEI